MADGRSVVLDRSRPRALRLTLPLLVLGALLLGAVLAARPIPASAVTPVASEPQDRQQLSDQPGAVTLAFDHEVDPGVAKVIVLGPDGQNVTSGPLRVEGTNVTSYVRDRLREGTYTVHFRIDGKGGDPEGGAYQFSIGSGRFTNLPDRSWSGEDHQPAVLTGTNPNGSEEPDPPSTVVNTPGIEVTSQAGSSDPNPPPTEDPSTVQPPPGSTTDAASGAQTSISPTPATSSGSGGSSGTPWIVGGVLLLAALAGTGVGVYRSRTRGAAEHE